MTTTDQHHSIDNLLRQPMYGRGWVVGPVTYVDRERRECAIWDRTDAPVIVEYRSEDEAEVCLALEQSDQRCLKALGLVEHWTGGRVTRVLEVERLFLIPTRKAERPTLIDLWHDLEALTTAGEGAKLPPDLAEHHDHYIAESIASEFDLDD